MMIYQKKKKQQFEDTFDDDENIDKEILIILP